MPIGLPAALAIGSIGSGVATGLLNRNQTQTVRSTTQVSTQSSRGVGAGVGAGLIIFATLFTLRQFLNNRNSVGFGT